MEQHISKDEIRRIIISDMVKKRNSIVPVIGEDTIHKDLLQEKLTCEAEERINKIGAEEHFSCFFRTISNIWQTAPPTGTGLFITCERESNKSNGKGKSSMSNNK